MDGGLVAGAVITHAGRVLLIRRAVAAGSLVWSFPSGKVEAGEEPVEAAVRESLEEAGVTVEALSVLGERLHPVTGWPVVYVACLLLSGEAHAASSREVAEVAWVGLEDLARLVPGGVFEPVQVYLDGAMTS
ncbi:NUDIX hydrolase [Streptomyces phaeochromogenes]|uniref:NUDIX hydrolase n=1 Tax=Streptomyces phaeochromogenes TaxID=1923 RepID=UPI002DD86FEB|nr:NUDIX hydrolase [Streptomyces phaeochromogenes]